MDILQSSLIDTIYLTFAHNQYAIAFFAGIIISLFLLLARPSRYAALLLLGFITLLVGFEYEKHIIGPLQEQTINSLGLNGDNSTEKLLLVRTFQKILPIFFFCVGWGSIFLAIILRGLQRMGNPKTPEIKT